MTDHTNRFSDALREAEKKLNTNKRPTRFEGMIDGESGMNNNLGSPYGASTFPKRKSWNRNERSLPRTSADAG